jgi:Domain of unknown function (DUF5658)
LTSGPATLVACRTLSNRGAICPAGLPSILLGRGCAHMSLHIGKLLLFLLLSICDLVLTRQLVEASSGVITESNPIAQAWLSYFGWVGLALFKGTIVLLVSGVAILLSWRRPRAAGRVLWFACMAVGGVVFYSCSLIGYLNGWKL